MIFKETPIEGAFCIIPELLLDERGHFSRIFCAEEYRHQGLNGDVSQSSVSYTTRAGTLRGMHYQERPHAECKLVRCLKGRAWDVIADVRPASSSYRQWWAVELRSDEAVMLYIPEGVAHGFLTLEDGTELLYQMSHPYVPESATGFRWNDAAFQIKWPAMPLVISDRDRSYPDFLA